MYRDTPIISYTFFVLLSTFWFGDELTDGNLKHVNNSSSVMLVNLNSFGKN